MTWSEFLDWLAYLDWESANSPWAVYLAQIATEVRRSYVMRPALVRLDEFLLRERPVSKPASSKDVWLRWAGFSENGMNHG